MPLASTSRTNRSACVSRWRSRAYRVHAVSSATIAPRMQAVGVELEIAAPKSAPPRSVDWKGILKRWTPVLALGLGILSQAFARHTIAFAPKAVAILVVAWTLAAGLGEWMPEAKPDQRHARWR